MDELDHRDVEARKRKRDTEEKLRSVKKLKGTSSSSASQDVDVLSLDEQYDSDYDGDVSFPLNLCGSNIQLDLNREESFLWNQKIPLLNEFHLKEINIHDSSMIARYFNLEDVIIDEISLEGLDGITLEALWKRLFRSCKIPINKSVKEFAWSVICSCDEMEIYELKEPRIDLVIYDNHDMLWLRDKLQDPYPECVINDKDRGIIGSCSTYHTRTNITSLLKKASLSEALTYGNKLVVVASQKLRRWAIFNPLTDPAVELNDAQYCMLEKIARARTLGALSYRSHNFSKDPKQNFYIRIGLLKSYLISKQSGHFRFEHHTVNGTIFFLARFHLPRKRKYERIVEYLVEVLKGKPGCRMEYVELQRMMESKGLFKRLLRHPYFREHIRTDLIVPYRELYPEAEKSEWKQKSSSREKTIRVIELIDWDLNLNTGNASDNDYNDSSDEDEKDAGEVRGLTLNRTLLEQAYRVVAEAGPKGCALKHIQKALDIDFYLARRLIRVLEKRNLLGVQKVESGRQNVFMYHSLCLNNPEDREKHIQAVEALKSPTPAPKKSLPFLKKMLKNQPTKEASTSFDTEVTCTPTIQATNYFNCPSAWHSLRDMYENLTLCEPIEGEVCYFSLPQKFHQISTVKMYFFKEEEMNGFETVVKNEEEVHDIEFEQMGLDDIKEPKQEYLEPKQEQAEPNVTRLEIFMGPNPIYLGKAVTDDEVEVELILSTPPPRLKKPGVAYTATKLFNQRFVKRANLIIALLAKEKLVQNTVRVQQFISKIEKEQGISYLVDRKSVARILKVLVEEGYVKIIKVILKSKGVCRTTTFICSPEITEKSPDFVSTLEHLKIAYFLLKAKPACEEAEQDDLECSVKEFRKVNFTMRPKYKRSSSIGRQYGFSPKFLRMQVLHELLFYLVYKFDKKSEPLSLEVKKSLLKKKDPMLSDAEIEALPPIYSEEICWRLFIPPLPEYRDMPRGWALMCDLLMRIPVCLFVKLYNVRFVVPELTSLLRHPIKQHILVKDLPIDIRTALLYKRIFIMNVYETAERLCFVGLVQFGQQKIREKDRTLMYCNRNAVLYNTTTSEGSYFQVTNKEYQMDSFYFDELKDIERYWYTMWNICMKTPLGRRSVHSDKPILLQHVDFKEDLLAATKGQTYQSAAERDVGYIPGDKLGAAGVDSALFSYRKSNWIVAKHTQKAEMKPPDKVMGIRKKKLDKTRIQSISFDALQSMQSSYVSLANRGKKESKKRVMKSQLRKKEQLRVLKARKQRGIQRVYYDKVDNGIMFKLKGSRALWSSSEDFYLLICRFASSYLTPGNKQMIPYSVMRDVFHKLCPAGRNKTSRACERRLKKLFRGKHERERNFSDESIKNIFYVRKYFSKFRERAHEKKVSESEIHIAFIYLAHYLSTNKEVKKLMEQRTGVKVTIDYLFSGNISSFTSAEDSELYYLNPKNVTDVICDTIRSVIHSAIGCQGNKLTLTFQLFKVYQSFPENLLKSVLMALREQQFFTLKKIPEQNRNVKTLVTLPCPFKFSLAYMCMHIVQYSLAIFEEAYEFFKMLVVDEPVCKLSNEDWSLLKQGHNIGLCEITTLTKLQIIFDIPDHVLLLNNELQDHSRLIEEMAKRYHYTLNRRDILVPTVVFKEHEQPKIKTKPKSNPKITIDAIIEKVIKAHDSQDIDEQLKLEMDIQNDLKSLDVEEDLEDEDKGKPEKEEVTPMEMIEEEPKPEKDETTTLSVEEIREELLTPSDQGSRKIPYIGDLYFSLDRLYPRSEGFLDNDEWYEELNRHFITVFPAPTFIDEEVHQELRADVGAAKAKEVLLQLRRDHVIPASLPFDDYVTQEIKNTYGSNSKISALVTFIHTKREIGTTTNEIKNAFKTINRTTLADILTFLRNLNVIIQVGISSHIYVHFVYKDSWLIRTHVITTEEKRKLKTIKEDEFSDDDEDGQPKEMIVRISPWYMVNGTLNLPVLKKWLGNVLSHCLECPATSFPDIAKRFCYLKPIDIYSLLQYLQIMDCIRLVVYMKEEVSLFSKSPGFDEVEALCGDEFKDLRINICKGAALKFGSCIKNMDEGMVQSTL